MQNIPTGNLPYVVVDKLPKKGEDYTIYGIPQEGNIKWNKNYCYYDGDFHEVDLSETTYSFILAKYQEEVSATIADLEARVENLEDQGQILFEGGDIELVEAGATRGIWKEIATGIVITEGTNVKVTLTHMTIDGEPVPDYEGEGTLYGCPGWDWQGCDFYDVDFGGGAYFSFGTEPKDAVATMATFGFVNEGDGFPVRTLIIGDIKVEVI